MCPQVTKKVEVNTLNAINWISENTFHGSMATKKSKGNVFESAL